MFNANNFIHHNFESEASQHQTIISALKAARNLEHDNFLIKSEISLANASDYLLDNNDLETIKKVKNFDFKKVFCRNPTQIEKKKGEEFSISKSDLPKETKEIKINQSLTTPSPLVLDVDLSPLNVQKFLLRKIKRNTSKINHELPADIQQMIRDYGDVCVNLTMATLKKYQYYNRFYNFAYSEAK